MRNNDFSRILAGTIASALAFNAVSGSVIAMADVLGESVDSILKSEFGQAIKSSMYLSDIDYVSDLSYSKNGTIAKDVNKDGSKMALYINGKVMELNKGLGVGVDSEVVYDISEYSGKYNTLSAFIGIDDKEKSLEKARFLIYTSNDGENWEPLYLSRLFSSGDNAEYVSVDIEGVKYIKLFTKGESENPDINAIYGDIRLLEVDKSKVKTETEVEETEVEETEDTQEIEEVEEEDTSFKSNIEAKFEGVDEADSKGRLFKAAAAAPTNKTVFGNDLEDRLIGKINNLEYRILGETDWADYTEDIKFTGDVTVEVRYKGSEGVDPSPVVTYRFTQSQETDVRTYIPISGVHLESFCSQEMSKEKAPATNMLDGNKNTYWHNRWAGDDDLFYTVRFDEIKFISSIEYLPYEGPNGKLRSGEVLVSYDGVNWELAGTFKDLKNNNELKTIDIGTPVPARYVKIRATQTWGKTADRFFSGRMFNFFEDTTKSELTEPMLVYSNLEETTNPVTVNVVYPENCVASEKSHKFLQNGTHEFRYTQDGVEKSVTATVSNIINVATDKGVYLSDLDTSPGTHIGYGSLKKDKNPADGIISLLVNGSSMSFKKGLGIHAPSTVIYNIERFSNEYSRFIGYVGVDASRKKAGSVIFRVSLSKDGETWDTVKTTDILTGESESVYLDINVKGYNYLKIYADQSINGNSVDHSVVADGRLVKEDYSASSDYYTGFKTLAQYDAEISARSMEDNFANHKKQVLEREFVNRYGYNNILSASLNEEGVYEALGWLQNDSDALQLLIEAGNLYNGSGYKALRALGSLYTEFKEDLSSPIYKKMFLATAVSYSKDLKSFANDYSGSYLQPNPVEIYRSMKQIFDREDGFVRKNEFMGYQMELIRAVVDTRIGYDEILWLRDYIDKKYPDKSRWERYNGYGYAAYRQPNYGSGDLYDPANKEKWDKKYGFLDYGIEYGKRNLYKSWMVMEKGGVCWGLSGLGSVVNEVQGIPVIGTYQVDHQAYMIYSQNAEGKGIWQMSDNIYGWAKSYTRWGNMTSTEHRLLFGWGQKEYNTVNGGNNTTYMMLGQDALNNYDAYLDSMFYNLISKSYEKSSKEHEDALYESLNHYSKNLDSIYDIYKSYDADATTTDQEWYELAEMIAEEYKYFPAPMNDLLKLIKEKLQDETFQISLDVLKNNSLLAAKVATNKESLQDNICREVANSLLGTTAKDLATFSFDGEDGGKIIISDDYAGSTIQARVSLDGGNTWETFGEGQEFTTDHVIQLTDEQISKINSTDDILVGLMGTPVNHTIDIIDGEELKGSIYQNDNENVIIGATNKNGIEFSTDGGQNWKDYDNSGVKSTTTFEGNVTVQFRYKATGLCVPGPISEYTFTEDTFDATSNYIDLRHVSVHTFSSEQSKSAVSSLAANSINGYYNDRWHTTWDRKDNEKYISFEFDEVKYINKIGYVPYDESGRARSGNIYVSMDGKTWAKAGSYNNLNPAAAPAVTYIPLDGTFAAKYVKIDSTSSYGTRWWENADLYFSARMFSFYEDTTKEFDGEAIIHYSTTNDTTRPVTATLMIGEDCTAEVYTHTFVDNGSYTFRYTDKDGNARTITATVDNITRNINDKEVYITDLSYDKSKSSVGSGSIREDRAPGGGKITVKINGKNKVFDRGLGAHARSTIVYDLGSYEGIYDRFQSYVGIDASKAPYGAGSASFTIYGSVNGEDWVELQKTSELTSTMNAAFIDVDISGYKYLKLYAYEGADNGSDHSVYAGAKLVRTKASVYYTNTHNNLVTASLLLPDGFEAVGDATHEFTANDTYTFQYRDASGEIKTIEAVVDWLDSNTSEKDDNIDPGFGVDKEEDPDTSDKDPNIDPGFGIDKEEDPDTSDKDPNIDPGFGVDKEEDPDTSDKDPNIDPGFGVDKEEDPDTSDKDPNIDPGFGVDKEEDPDTSDKDPNIDPGFGVDKEEDPDTSEKDPNIDDGFLVDGTRELEVEFSTKDWTNEDVIVSLVGLHPEDKIIDGAKSYRFSANGKHTFVVEDKYGNRFEKEVVVSWIDKDAPVAKVTFDYEELLKGKVIAKLVDMSEEGVTILNEDGLDYHEFKDNGEYTFKFVDKAGNTGEVTAKVDWLDLVEIPNLITYENEVKDGKIESVFAKLSIDGEKLEVVNNEGRNEIKFIKNGEYRFRIRVKETGYEFDITVKVDCLEESAGIGESPIEIPQGGDDSEETTPVDPSEPIIKPTPIDPSTPSEKPENGGDSSTADNNNNNNSNNNNNNNSNAGGKDTDKNDPNKPEEEDKGNNKEKDEKAKSTELVDEEIKIADASIDADSQNNSERSIDGRAVSSSEEGEKTSTSSGWSVPVVISSLIAIVGVIATLFSKKSSLVALLKKLFFFKK